ncbi:MAG: outer membrane lipoprotein-sorting protein [Bacteroidales bacterium]|nr:outer membrane lipoprotein-sorting protein [Bacteroidales bacterium]MDT8432896.1 outer membrane lipoprotein-sorting protein [Bacteroidales bacterium]
MKYSIIILAILFCAGNSHAQDPLNIVKASQKAMKVKSFEAVSTLTITDNRGNERIRKSSMASKTYPDQTEKRIIKFVAPAEVEGTGILIFDYEDQADDMWIYLPALRKTRRIVSTEKSSSFMGSEFSNADMTAPAIRDFTYTLLGTEVVNGTECWKITAVPVDISLEDMYGYSTAIRWIGKEDNVVRKSAYFDFSETLIKTIETIKFMAMDPAGEKYMVTEMVALNHESGRRSTMKMDQVQTTDTKDEYFTISYLER